METLTAVGGLFHITDHYDLAYGRKSVRRRVTTSPPMLWRVQVDGGPRVYELWVRHRDNMGSFQRDISGAMRES